MTIGEYIKLTDIEQYNKLMKMFKQKEDATDRVARAFQVPSQILNKIELGCSVEELMRADSYKCVGRRVKQRGWG